MLKERTSPEAAQQEVIRKERENFTTLNPRKTAKGYVTFNTTKRITVASLPFKLQECRKEFLRQTVKKKASLLTTTLQRKRKRSWHAASHHTNVLLQPNPGDQ
jgi:hypothetical protein